ncbi:MAG: glycosyltransferase family 2 protein, partial [Saprospiraceae bacterium]
MTQVPIVSVIMPVYNGGTYLHTAIQSILHQKFSDFEFIIINDGSSDNSLEIIESFEDKRIKCISFEQNQGIVAALNKGVESSKGKYIARMDADDISHPERLGKQVDFLEKRTEIGIVGTGAFIFSINKNNKIKGHSYPLALLENIPIKL